ncbi:MAG: major capsid protein [Planctomycetota bacterium]
MLTTLDIAKMNGSDAFVGLIDETVQLAPEVMVGAARTIKGRQYKTLVRTGLPPVSFRNANEGSPASKSNYENRLVETFILNPAVEVDKANADSHEDGPEAAIAIEAAGVMEASMQLLSKQFYYGTSSDAKGHPGLVGSYDAANMTVDATGTSADQATSAWLVKFGRGDVTWVWGENGQMDMRDPREVRLTDTDGNPYDGYRAPLCAYPGLQVGSKRSAVRIANLTAQSGKGLTDALLNDALGKFPVGQPDAIFLTRQSLLQLANSRVQTTRNAQGTPPAIPTEIAGIGGVNIPIYATNGISNTEAIVP